MARMAVPQELFDVIAHKGPMAWALPHWFRVAMTKTAFKVVDDRATREKFGYAGDDVTTR